MADSKKCSLWLRPQGEIAFSLQQRIKKLSEKYDTPTFEPHITLLGGLLGGETELIQLADTLAASFEPFDIVLTQAEAGNSFYQSVFVLIQKTDELMNARKTARQMFSVEANDKADRFPHLSLMYGDFPRDKKEEVLNSMGREFHIRFRVQNLMLIETSGQPRDWKKIHSAEFAKGS